jgi:hypothetical protein
MDKYLGAGNRSMLHPAFNIEGTASKVEMGDNWELINQHHFSIVENRLTPLL